VTVLATVPVEGVSLNKTSTKIYEGSTEQLTATITPNDAANQNITWTSSDTSVATVSSSGLVTAVSNGTATITVSTEDGGYSATCEVRVLHTTSINFSNNTFPERTTDNVTISFDDDYCYYYDNNYGIGFYYSNGTFTVSVPSGYSLDSIGMTFTYNAVDLTASSGSFTRSGYNASWESDSATNTVTFTIPSRNVYISRSFTVNYYKN